MTPGHNRTENPHVQALKTSDRRGNLGLATHLAEDREEHRIGLLGDDQSVGHGENGRRVDDDEIELFFQLGEEGTKGTLCQDADGLLIATAPP